MKFLKLLGDAFLDHQGGVSVMRILSFLVSFVVLGVWIAFMFVEGGYIPLGWAEAGLIGLVSSAKAAQSRFELGQGGLKDFPEEEC